MNPILPTLIALSLVISAQGQGPKGAKPPTDREQVIAAALDYVEGIYDAEPQRLVRSVAKDLDKVGVSRDPQKGHYRQQPMTFEQLHSLAATYNKDGSRIPKDAPKKVEVLALLPKVALVKLTASWGVDYMQMSRSGDAWQIKHIAWQMPPRPSKTAVADRAAIKKAVTSYATAFYTAKPQLIDTWVDAKLAKFGYYRARGAPMSFAQVRSLAATLHKGSPAPSDSPKVVEILGCLDNIACAKLSAAWGIDLMNLVRTDDGWKIRQVVWQSHPPVK